MCWDPYLSYELWCVWSFEGIKYVLWVVVVYFPAVISAAFASIKVFDTFTKLFFFVFYLLVLQAKNVLVNQSYMQKTTYRKWVWADTSI